MSEWRYEMHGDYIWLFADYNVINMRQVRRNKLVDENVHQLTNLYGYHEFQPVSEASKGVGA